MPGPLRAVTVTRRRTLPDPPQVVWELIADPHHQPRWWPGVERVEAVSEDRFTQVLRTQRGRPVRIDFAVVASEPPGHAAWRQELAGTPFARVLEESRVQFDLEPDGSGTAVTLGQAQRLRGYSRTGGFMLRRATAKRLDAVLEGLESACPGGAAPPTDR